MHYINQLLQFWIETDWYFALLMSIMVNIVVFVSTAAILDYAIAGLISKYKVGGYIDDRPLKLNQKKMEIKNGVVACVIFGVGSLITRELFNQVWPISFVSLLIQLAAFMVFYESYSYFIHRLLHTKPFLKIHGVHHKSVRVTPWSAYSVHPVEAIFIAMSAPIFMSVFPLSLGVALILHIFGMMFTILIHSNYNLIINNTILGKISDSPQYHSVHHLLGNVNFGFVNSFWDRCFKTRF
ncbi:sterol desaturase family protein [Endozoicomonas sp. SM1973]|uniref:Sterol desaturase family protein n=1 Tax=Spartinivicinus marinus TaxID=2994442 RepID=A0A853IBS9_9GAMM|nr:sterol desaturase family protein [Spartinivicinus marinus]MCX4026254.1 sterol desaturase family protein [Spartinivicinus marinus]NYZ67331.1 sterol desaturase family protein [Spartinivicinus marinus]